METQTVEYDEDALRRELADVKVMVGGAVLTEEYARKIGADKYAAEQKAEAERITRQNKADAQRYEQERNAEAKAFTEMREAEAEAQAAVKRAEAMKAEADAKKLTDEFDKYAKA